MSSPLSDKRILIFSTAYFPLVGGAEVAMKELTDRLTEFEFDLVCAKIQRGLPSTERIGNVTVHRCGFGISFDKYLLPLLGVLRAQWIARRQSFDLIWSLMASYGGFAALVYKTLHPKTKMLLTLQEGDPLEHYDERAGALSFLHRKIFERADAVQAISQFLADWSVKMGFKGTPVVIPNGVDLGRFGQRISAEEGQSLRRSLGFAEQDVVLVTSSRLSLKNGVDDLIRSLAHLPGEVKCLVIGDGEDRKKLEGLVQELNLKERVFFLGKRGHDELPALLQASDIFIRPSLSEGLGISFLEAMAAGLPIIGTNVGGIPDFLIDGETGVFCEVRNPESIAMTVRRLLTEGELREKIVRRGEALVKEKYGWNGIVERIAQILKER